MARQENVERVLNAIETVYRSADGKRPSKGEIIAAAGVAPKTYYRILESHEEVQDRLRLADALFKRRPMDGPDDDDDPIKANPMAAVEELLETITQLVDVIESQRNRIGTLEQQLGIRAIRISDGQPVAAPKRLRRR